MPLQKAATAAVSSPTRPELHETPYEPWRIVSVPFGPTASPATEGSCSISSHLQPYMLKVGCTVTLKSASAGASGEWKSQNIGVPPLCWSMRPASSVSLGQTRTVVAAGTLLTTTLPKPAKLRPTSTSMRPGFVEGTIESAGSCSTTETAS